MNSAGLSVIRARGLLCQTDIKQLQTLGKLERNIVIGKIRGMFKDFSMALSAGIRSTMHDFITVNGIEDDDIISINNDAVTFITDKHNDNIKRVVDDVTFKMSGEYDTMAVISRITFLTNGEDIHVKGISDNARERTRDFIQEKIRIWMAELNNGVDKFTVLKEITAFRKALASNNLDIGYYRSVRTGDIKLNSKFSRFTSLTIREDFIDNEWKKQLDPSEVVTEILIPFSSMLLE